MGWRGVTHLLNDMPKIKFFDENSINDFFNSLLIHKQINKAAQQSQAALGGKFMHICRVPTGVF
jgi:hypothetical protein